MGNTRSTHKLTDEEMVELTEETGFTSKQIDRLYERFFGLDKQQKGHLTREDFLRIPELAINPLGDRIVHAFFSDERRSSPKSAKQELDAEDTEKIGDVVHFDDFVRVMSHFRPLKKTAMKNKLNTREHKLRFAFRMYDLDNDGRISKEELLAVLTMMVGANISPDQLISIADRTVMEADANHDNFISFEEYCKVLECIDVEQKMSIFFLS